LTVVPIDDEIEQKAIELRKTTSLKLPDCVIAATTIVLDAILLTDDDDLLRLSLPEFHVRNIF
jgi:predicted nucleic acid-binding protein